VKLNCDLDNLDYDYVITPTIETPSIFCRVGIYLSQKIYPVNIGRDDLFIDQKISSFASNFV
jgi:hypothetical protein